MVALRTDDSRRYELRRSASSLLGLMETVIEDNSVGDDELEFKTFEAGTVLMGHAMSEEVRRIIGVEFIPQPIVDTILDGLSELAFRFEKAVNQAEAFKKGMEE